MILTLQSTTFSAFGGIPTYNRLVCRVLNEIGTPKTNQVLIATDKVADIETPRLELANLQLEAFDQNRLALIRRFITLAVTCKIDLALIGHVNYAPLGWMLKKLQPRLRYGVMLYGVEAWQTLPRLKRHALQHADFLISISAYTKQKASESNALNPDLIHLLPNALEWTDGESPKSKVQSPKVGDLSQLSHASGQRISANAVNLLSVCRLESTERYKGVDKVIEALPEVAKRVPEIRYTIVGDGTDLARHKELAEKLNVADHIDFLGYLPEQELRACYRGCDVFVMPSAGEGFGFVFLEAMKFAKPIVAARSAGAPEVIEDGITGRLVEYGNQEDLARSLIELCLDRDARTRLGEAGYRRLQDKFRFSNFKTKFAEILSQELLHTGYEMTQPDESASCAS